MASMSTASDRIGPPVTCRKARPAAGSDEALLLQYRATRNPDAFRRLVLRYETELFRYLSRYLGDATAAEDVFQQTFLQIHLKCDQYEPGRPVRPWVYAIATNQAIDSTRRNKRHRYHRLDTHGDADQQRQSPTVEAGDPQPWVNVQQKERSRHVRFAVNRLSEPLRQVVQLIYFQGMKYQEAADALRLPIGTVKSRVHAALNKLGSGTLINLEEGERARRPITRSVMASCPN